MNEPEQPTEEENNVANQYRQRLKSHPLIAALRPLPIDVGAEMGDELKYLPSPPNRVVRAFPPSERLEHTYMIRQLHVPLKRDIQLAFDVDAMIRDGLRGRPVTAEHLAMSETRVAEFTRRAAEDHPEPEVDAVEENEPGKIQAPCSSLIARSGEGKTRAIHQVLNRYAQVIRHDTIANPLLPVKQVVYLHLECPADRTMKSLVSDFVVKLSKAVREKLPRCSKINRSELVDYVGNLCETYWIGLIVIDECQHAQRHGEPATELMNFLVEMSNTLNVPILYVGTPAALKVIGRQLRQARRMVGPAWAAYEPESVEWKKLIDSVWPYQFTKTLTPLTPEVLDEIYYCTQGIPGFFLILFLLAQRMAIRAGGDREGLTPLRFRAVYDDYFGPVRPMLDAIRSKDPARIQFFEDLVGSDEVEFWFKSMTEHKEGLHLKAAGKVTRAHKAHLKAILRSAKTEMTELHLRSLAEAGAGDSLEKLLLAMNNAGLDAYAFLKEATQATGAKPKGNSRKGAQP